MNFRIRAETVLNTTQAVIEALNKAKGAQDKAQEAIDKATEDIDSARKDLGTVSVLEFFTFLRNF